MHYVFFCWTRWLGESTWYIVREYICSTAYQKSWTMCTGAIIYFCFIALSSGPGNQRLITVRVVQRHLSAEISKFFVPSLLCRVSLRTPIINKQFTSISHWLQKSKREILTHLFSFLSKCRKEEEDDNFHIFLNMIYYKAELEIWLLIHSWIA